MFDTTIVRTAAPYPQTITRHEHRAPTDDSIRLAREYEDRAKNAVLWSHDFTDNTLNGRVVCFSDIDGQYVISIGFTLNGEKHQISHKMCSRSSLVKTRQEAAKMLLDAIAAEFVRHFIPRIAEASRL